MAAAQAETAPSTARGTQHPWVQLVFALLAMIMIANLQYAWTLFVGPIQRANGWKLAEVQLAFTLFILLQTWVQPLDGWLIDRLGPRLFITAAGVLCGFGWTAMGYASTLTQLYTFYAIAGVGAAFVYSGCIGSALKWFPSRRGFASGIIAAGFGGGTALFIPIITALIRQYSYHTAFLVTGVLQGIVIAAAAQFLRHPGPEFESVKPSPGPKSKARRSSEHFSTGEMLKTAQFYMLYIMFVAMATGGLLVTAQAGPLVASWGLAAAALTAATALSPVANGGSRIFWGWLSDRTGREVAMAIAFFLQAGCLLAVLTIGRTSGTWFTITLVLTFFTWGEVFSLFPSTLGDYFGSRHSTSNYGILYSAKGVASIIGGFTAAKIYEQFGSWDSVFYGSAALALAAGILALILKSRPLPRRLPSG